MPVPFSTDFQGGSRCAAPAAWTMQAPVPTIAALADRLAVLAFPEIEEAVIATTDNLPDRSIYKNGGAEPWDQSKEPVSMIVVVAGMQKSGSGWYYRMINDLLVAAGHRDARELREEHGLHDLLQMANCGLANMHADTLIRLDEVSRNGNTFATKTHRPPSKALRRLLSEGSCRAAYVYRDPRDVIISALDHGKRMREEGKRKRHLLIGPYRSFAKLHTVKGALLWFRLRVQPVYEAWTSCDHVLVTRYEDLLTDALAQIKRAAPFLDLDITDQRMTEIVDAYQPKNLDGDKSNTLHMNKGVAGRFREVLSAEEQDLCRKRLGKCLDRMGYPD